MLPLLDKRLAISRECAEVNRGSCLRSLLGAGGGQEQSVVAGVAGSPRCVAPRRCLQRWLRQSRILGLRASLCV